MIAVTAQFHTLVRHAAGRSTVALEMETGTRVLDVLEALADRYGAGFRQLVLPEPGRPNPHLRLFLDGELLLAEQMNRELTDSCDLHHIFGVSGG